MALGSQCLWFLVVWFWIWECEWWNWGGICLKHLICQSVEKKTFSWFCKQFQFKQEQLEMSCKDECNAKYKRRCKQWETLLKVVHFTCAFPFLKPLMEIRNMTISNPRIRWSSGQKVLPLLAWCLVQNSITDSLCTLLLVYWNNNGAWRFPRSFGLKWFYLITP